MSTQVVVHNINCARLYPGRVESGAETRVWCGAEGMHGYLALLEGLKSI